MFGLVPTIPVSAQSGLDQDPGRISVLGSVYEDNFSERRFEITSV